MGDPSVSVVIATYNRGALIAPTLDSVLAQEPAPDEVLVVDDGSTDATAEWIRAHYPQVRVVTVPNGGTSLARNRGAQQAQGDVIVFLDHDDLMLPGALATLLDLLERFPRARAAFADHELKDETSGQHFRNHHSEQAAFHRLRAVPAIEEHGADRLYGVELRYAMLRGNLLQQPWAVYREVFRELGGFDPQVRYCEDWELYMRLVWRHPIALTDRVISVHLIEGGNLHRRSGQEIQHMKVLRKHLALSRGDRRATRTLRARLANYYKTSGDVRRADGHPGAWRDYMRSLRTWPFDPVVIVRCVAWAPRGVWEVLSGRTEPDPSR